MTRKELDNFVRENSLQKEVLTLTGKCYSRCSKEELEKTIDTIKKANEMYDGVLYEENNTSRVNKLTLFKLFTRWLKEKLFTW